ncbi:MAG: DUF2213 domain-containing protein [Deltaproteobacteria bacterium]|nr:DUF2213 domain-containing protein [Deltaproteobacteria bacterium]
MMRHDQGGLASPTRANGALIVEGVAGRAHAPGDALEYTDGPEYRQLDEVERIVAQLAGLPVYLGHPVGGSYSGATRVGVVESGRLDGDRAIARIRITDQIAAAAIARGTRQLSLGYSCEVDSDRYQHRIHLDHISIVDAARCGAVCAIRGDRAQLKETSMCKCNGAAPTTIDAAERFARDAMIAREKRRYVEHDPEQLRLHDRREATIAAARARHGDSIPRGAAPQLPAAELAARQRLLDSSKRKVTP